jgi:hypothetical protein
MEANDNKQSRATKIDNNQNTSPSQQGAGNQAQRAGASPARETPTKQQPEKTQPQRDAGSAGRSETGNEKRGIELPGTPGLERETEHKKATGPGGGRPSASDQGASSRPNRGTEVDPSNSPAGFGEGGEAADGGEIQAS